MTPGETICLACCAAVPENGPGMGPDEAAWHPLRQEVPSMSKQYDVMMRTLYDREPADSTT